MLENVEEGISEILSWLQKYKERTGCRGVVIGLSGGKDSTTVAMLCKKVWGDNIFAVLMPHGDQVDLDDAHAIAKTLRLKHITVFINDAYRAIVDGISNSHIIDRNGDTHLEYVALSDKAETNIPPRLRMTILYAIAQSFGYQVVGTGNASESYVGWCTKWGDCACDFNPIAHLTCTEVVQVGKHLAKEFGLDEKYIIKTPADGLTGRSDEDNFGFTYETLDGYINGEIHPDPAIVQKIEAMHWASVHKRVHPASIDNY